MRKEYSVGLKQEIIDQALKDNEWTIACVACKKNLWLIKIEGRYGTKVKFKDFPFPGVPPYRDFWEKDQKTAKRTDCPHCSENYLQALEAHGKYFARPYIVELDSGA